MTHPLIETNFTAHGPYYDTHSRVPAIKYTCKKPECSFAVVIPSAEPLSQETETGMLTHLSTVHVEQPMIGDFPESQNVQKFIDAGSAGMQNAAREVVQEYYNANLFRTGPGHWEWLAFEDTYVVWFSKTLQNFKAVISTTVEDARYYEVTFDGDKNVFYLDVYKKEVNKVVNG